MPRMGVLSFSAATLQTKTGAGSLLRLECCAEPAFGPWSIDRPRVGDSWYSIGVPTLRKRQVSCWSSQWATQATEVVDHSRDAKMGNLSEDGIGALQNLNPFLETNL